MRIRALIAPMLLYDNGLIQHIGMKLAFSGTRMAPVPHNLHDMKEILLRIFSIVTVLSSQPVFALSGAFVAFNGEVLELGGFDPIFGHGNFEDVDLSLRWKESVGLSYLS